MHAPRGGRGKLSKTYMYERKNERKQKNALSDFFAAKDHVGRGGHCRQGDWDTFLIKTDHELFCPRRAGESWC